MATKNTEFLRLEIPNENDYYDSKMMNRNIDKINAAKRKIETQIDGVPIIPVELLTTINNFRIYHIKINEDTTTIAGSLIYIPGTDTISSDGNVTGGETITLKIAESHVYSVYFMNNRCYIYWC